MIIVILMSLLCLLPISSVSNGAVPAPTPSPSPEPVVTITSPSWSKNKKYYLFPLEIPALVVRGVSWPFIQAIKLVEDKWLGKRPQSGEKKPRRFSAFPILQAGGGEGFGLGFGFKIDDIFGAGDLGADYTYFFDVDNRAALVFLGNPIELGGRPFQYEFLTSFRNRNEAQFFGVGADSEEDDEARYAYNQLLTGFNLHYEVLPHFNISLPLQFMTVETNPAGAEILPHVETVFPPSELVGFDDRINYFITGISLAHDTRDSVNYPLKGGYRAFRFWRFQSLGGPFSFNQYDVVIRQYFPFWKPRFVIALKNEWVFQQATGGGAVPFNLLADLDHYSPLRGFVVGRFRDEASVLFNLEYRFPIWGYTSVWEEKASTFIDGLVFVDTGKVFPGITDFSFDDWRYSVGGGLNILMKDQYFMRLTAGYGGEGALVYFLLGNPF